MASVDIVLGMKPGIDLWSQVRIRWPHFISIDFPFVWTDFIAAAKTLKLVQIVAMLLILGRFQYPFPSKFRVIVSWTVRSFDFNATKAPRKKNRSTREKERDLRLSWKLHQSFSIKKRKKPTAKTFHFGVALNEKVQHQNGSSEFASCETATTFNMVKNRKKHSF